MKKLNNENIGQLIKTRWGIFEDNQFMSKHTYQRIYPSTYLFQLLIYILNGNDISLNSTNYPIFNMQDYINDLSSSMLDLYLVRWYPFYECFSHVKGVILFHTCNEVDIFLHCQPIIPDPLLALLAPPLLCYVLDIGATKFRNV